MRSLRAPLATVIAAWLTGRREPTLAAFHAALRVGGTLDAGWAAGCAYVGHSDIEKQRRAALSGKQAPAVALAGLLDCAATPCARCSLKRGSPATELSAWRLLRATSQDKRIAHAASAEDPTNSLAQRLHEGAARDRARTVAEDLEAAIVMMAPQIATHRDVDIVRDLGRAALAEVGGGEEN